MGIGNKVIDLVEEKHSQAVEWVLETPHDLNRNHHLYEKKGYKRTGREDKATDNLIIVHYQKSLI
jgi:hypothetical protein